MRILSFCNCLHFLFKKNEDIIHNKNIEIEKLSNTIQLLEKKIKNLEYELKLKNNIKNVNYENYTINNEYYRTSEDIEEGYTVFE